MAHPTMSERVRAAKGEVKAGRINFADQIGQTRQEFADECDINAIMKRYTTRGILPPTKGVGTYGDFSDVGDYMAAQQRLVTAREQFESLPAALRARLRNSPAEFLVWIADKRNWDEARKYGLLKEETVKPEVKPDVKIETLQTKKVADEEVKKP